MFAILTLLVAMLSIQSGASLAKQLFPALGVPLTTALRIGFAALILCLIWRPWRQKLGHQGLRHVLIYGVALGLMNLTFYLSLQKIPLGVAVALEFTGPLAVAIFSSRRKIDFLWVLLATVGIFLILPFQATSAHLDLIGIFFALIAGGFWALYIIFGQKISSALSGGIAASYGMMVAAIVVLPFALGAHPQTSWEFSLFPLAFALAVLSSALPYSLEMVVLKTMPMKTFGIFMSVEPALAAFSGFVFLGEKLQAIQWLAIACVIAASAGSASSQRASSEIKAEG